MQKQISRVAEFFIIGERFVVITRQLQAAEVLSKLSTMNDKSSFVQVPVLITKQLVITKQLKLYFNNSSRIPTQAFHAAPNNSFLNISIGLRYFYHVLPIFLLVFPLTTVLTLQFFVLSHITTFFVCIVLKAHFNPIFTCLSS
jgi:hypothetical protein